MPGAKWRVERAAPLDPIVGRCNDTYPQECPWAGALPDFNDPATRGCLEHQVRERFAARVWIKWWCAYQPAMSGADRSWCEAVDGMGRRLVAGPTVEHKNEVSAWLAALESAAKVAS